MTELDLDQKLEAYFRGRGSGKMNEPSPGEEEWERDWNPRLARYFREKDGDIVAELRKQRSLLQPFHLR